jgi:hypothetical protein
LSLQVYHGYHVLLPIVYLNVVGRVSGFIA